MHFLLTLIGKNDKTHASPYPPCGVLSFIVAGSGRKERKRCIDAIIGAMAMSISENKAVLMLIDDTHKRDETRDSVGDDCGDNNCGAWA